METEQADTTPGPVALKKKRNCYSSAEQSRRLVELLTADPRLRSGKFSATFTKKVAQERWKAIALELNSLGGAYKTYVEWRKSYHDKKSTAKKKAAAVGRRRSARATGSVCPAEQLNNNEHLLLSCISQDSIYGHSEEAEESEVPPFSLETFVEIDPLSSEIGSVEDSKSTYNETEAHGHNQPIEDTASISPTASRGSKKIKAETEEAQGNRPRRQAPRGRQKTALQTSLNKLVTEMRSKNESKDVFHREVLNELKRHSIAMESIKDSFASIARSLAIRNSPFL